MTSSRPETPTRITGAHRAHGEERARPNSAEAPEALEAPGTAEAPELPGSQEVHEVHEVHEVCGPYLDGLYTYSLSVLCDRDAATSAVGAVLAVVDRRGSRLPGEGERRAWLYALARWACL
ncbi:hypothetical protein HW445_19055, partial [Streptomyces sp. UH6]|nr:hypothetical protein [Streptomyces sp. UH6]